MPENRLKEAFERNQKLLKLKPSKGQYTTMTEINLLDGTTCEVKHKQWTFKADVGKTEGGNDEGPGPGILFRAALGSCLAIGYAKIAALHDVPIDNLRVEVEADVDARGSYGIDNIEPGYKAMRYKVLIESPAPEEAIEEVIKQADAQSPILQDVRNPVPIDREILITKPQE